MSSSSSALQGSVSLRLLPSLCPNMLLCTCGDAHAGCLFSTLSPIVVFYPIHSLHQEISGVGEGGGGGGAAKDATVR